MGVAAVVLAATLAYGQDPADQTPWAPGTGAQVRRGRGRGRAGGEADAPRAAEALPQMPMNGGDVNRDEIVAQERAGLEARKSGDVAKVGAALTDDAVFVRANGILQAGVAEAAGGCQAEGLHDERCAVRAGVAGQRGGVVYVDGERDAAGPGFLRLKCLSRRRG